MTAELRRGPARPVDVLAIGDTSADLFVSVPYLPGRDQKAMGRFLGIHGGGMSANFAVAAAREGAVGALASVLGDDERGRACLRELVEQGIDTTAVTTVDGVNTWFCIVQLDPSGEKALTGAMTEIKVPPLEQITDQLLARAALVAPLADDVAWATEVAMRAKRQGCLVAVDLEAGAMSDGLGALDRLLRHTDLAFTNRAGLASAGHHNLDDAARILLRSGPAVAVVTLGADGAVCAAGVQRLRSRALPSKVVDSTGAGDAFSGAFASAYLRGAPLADCLRRATAMSALAVGSLGARTYTAGPEFDQLAARVDITAHHPESLHHPESGVHHPESTEEEQC
ncbi:MAG TPA: carbohydrate kinase family protein [Pseudonocardia sp.]|uniref:carbohydrate kinase family protein n=1 Tax=Pseudonocardia sp. TaxID=60912 RepID=UPI002D0D269F|nr:carbohydrate kinase family protein [Pseudonocardia sp.]HTF48627.1 carbohydrate kinase family protein [Pseudonocardia sp.]